MADWYSFYKNNRSANFILNDLNICRAPINIYNIIQQTGVVLNFVKDSKWQAAVDSTKRTPEIYVCAQQDKKKMRWYAAHCYGHLICHGPGKVFREHWDKNKINTIEMQANLFSTDLLVPSWLLTSYVSYGNVLKLNELSKTFQVPEQLIYLRLKELNYILDE